MRKLVLLGLFVLTALFGAISIAQANGTHKVGMSLVWSDKSTYDDWEPTLHGTLSFTVTVSGLYAASVSEGNIRFDFEKVSNWEGTCMNADEGGKGTNPDLLFEYNDQSDPSPLKWQSWKGGQKKKVAAEWKSSDNLDGFTMNITVRCEDYGAFGILRARVYKRRFSLIPDDLLAECVIPIPKDDNLNYMADKLDAIYGYTNPAKDGETGPSPGMGVEQNNNFGDGLVEFEEYRGFMINRSHTRLHTTKKDIFVHSQFTGWGAAPGVAGFSSGIGDAANLPSVFETHEIRKDEVKNGDDSRKNPDRTVNFNSLGKPKQFGAGDKWRVQDTKALWVYKEGSTTSGNPLGYVDPVVGAPPDVDEVNIYEGNIALYAPTIRLGTPANPSDADVVDQTIGHEMGHGVALNHPWHTPVPTGSTNPPNDGGWFGFSGGLANIKTPLPGPGAAYDLLTQHINYAGTTRWNAHATGAWTIPVGSYVANLPRSSPAASFTYTYGSTIMDYDMPFTQTNRDGIYPSTSFHNLHSWEYRLLGSSVSSQESPQWTPRTPVTLCLSISKTPGKTAQLSPYDDTYTASAGDSHTSNFSTDSPYTSVQWYVKPPGDTSERGTLIETDTGDGSATTASLSYTFAASAVAGAYIITAYVTTPDGVYEVSYTVTIPTVPGTPSVGVIGIMGDDRIYLSWRKPSDDGGAAITDYEYRYRIVGSTDEGTWTSGGMDFNETVSGLSTDTIYEIEVRARNSVGFSDASTPMSFYTRMTKTVPSQPLSLSAVAGDGLVELSWLPPSDIGNSDILRYEYRYGIGELATPESYTAWESMGSAMAKYPVSPLTNDMYHIFEVRAVNAIGNSAPSDPATATPTAPVPDPITPPDPPPPTPTPSPPTSVPKQPTGLSVVSISNGTVELSWSDPEGGGVDEYEYRVDPNNDGTWNDWESLDSKSTKATLNLQNGRTYGIQVRAVNSLGSSTKSTKVTAMPVDSSVSTPSAPRNLTATAGNGQVKLSWNAPSTGSGIIDYEYKYDTNDDGSWRSWKITDSTSTAYTVTGLTNDTLYAFKVRARNAGGIGSASSKVSATPINMTVPSKPRNLTAAMTTDDRIKLDWDAPVNTGGSPITDYEYRYDTDNDGSWTSWRTTGDTNTYEYFRGFSDDTTYAYQIRAENKVGAGPASNKAVITTPPGIVPPSIPLTFSATAGHASVSLSWHPPTDDGGDSSIAYQYRYKKSGTAYTGWSAEQSSLFAKITGLTADSVYRFELRAKNSAGHSPIVIATAIPKAPTVPGKPTGLSVVSTSNGTVKISWSAPENDGGDSIGDYEYRIDPNNDGTWNDWESLDSNSTSATLNLQNGRNYGIEVRAKNSVGKSVKSTKVSAMPIDPSVSTPSAPRNLTATAGNRQVRLSWNTPSTSNGIIDYEYRLDTDDDGSWRKWKVTDSTSTAYTVTGLTNETTYAFLVRARNAGGAGSQSTKVTATPTNITVPGAPRNLTVSGIDRTTVSLVWDAPLDDGGSAITSYRYHIDTHNDGSWEELDNLNTTSTSAYLYRFNPGETYAFMVSAVNEVGAGTTSNIAVITMQSISPPSAPQYLSADEGNASVYLSWSYPADDGGGYVDYQYRYRQSGGTWSEWSAIQWESYATIDTLTNGTSYEFEVVATNDAGMGTAATVSATPTGSAVPGVPTYFYADSENGAVELWWDPPEFDGGSPITDYEYNYRQSGGSWNGWTATGTTLKEYDMYYSVSGLTNGTTYQFKVRAKNAVGTGPSTETLSATPQPRKPDAPTGLSATAGTTTGSIDLSWTAPNDNGSPITGYMFRYCKYENGWKKWTKYSSTGSASTAYTVTGLESGELYRFRVAATNSVGDSRSSRAAQTTAP